MRSVIVGGGEIGSALANVLRTNYRVDVVDKNIGVLSPMNIFGEEIKKSPTPPQYDFMHICFPYSEEFDAEVARYQALYTPTYTIIHSTVPVGTSTRLGTISSPVTGIHPKMENSLLTFTKFIGGEQASLVADYFRRAGMKVYLFDKSETAELMKILDTTGYGLWVEWTKEVKRLCNQHGVPFEAWTLATENYNHGYQRLGYPEYTRPNLTPIMKKIGGHCVRENLEFLPDNIFASFIKSLQ